MAQQRVERRLAAILAADVVGYSRLTGADEEGTLARLKALRHELIDPAIAAGRGRVVKTMGDGILIEFPSVVEAVRCAIEVQRGTIQRNAGLGPEQKIEFRVGIHLGDVVVDGGDLLGDGVNIAARLEGISETGGIALSEDAFRLVQGKVAAEFVDLGEHSLKNIARPVRVYRVAAGEVAMAPVLALPDKPSIAVLPFQNMSGDPEQEYFADGMTEDVITALSKLRWLFVIARNSTFTYKGRAVDVKQVGRELGVRYVLEGSVRKAAKRIRVTAQLVEAENGHHVWAERYDRDLADVFAVQDEITASVVGSIEPELFAAEGYRVQRRPPDSLTAWECSIRAFAHMSRRTREDSLAAQVLLERTIQIDPNYAHALSLLAYELTLGATSGWQPREPAMRRAWEIARRAAQLDPDDPWAHLAIGFVHAQYRRSAEGLAAFQQALRLNPNFALAYTMSGLALAYLGRAEEAFAALDTADRLSPRGLVPSLGNLHRAGCCFIAGRYREGADYARRAVQSVPNSVPIIRILIANCAMAGEIEEARSALEQLKAMVPGLSLAMVTETVGYSREDDLRRWREAFERAGLS